MHSKKVKYYAVTLIIYRNIILYGNTTIIICLSSEGESGRKEKR